MRAEIISVGTELLLGDILNTNARFLAQQLATLGFEVYYQTVVGDNPGRLRALVLEAKDRSDVLIFTGGLGPTDDDLTKETVAEAFGDFLVLDQEELLKLEEFFISRGRDMTPNNRKQAMVPRRGRKLPNANGTAPGVLFRQGGKYAFLLPGPPIEMEPMFLEQVAPILESMQDSSIRSVTLRVFGIGESDLEDKVRDLLNGTNPTAALYAKTGEVHIRITAKAQTAEQADVMCDEYASTFRRILGEYLYSDNGDSLEAAAVHLLIAEGSTVATAESCTGGMLGQCITAVPGASAVYGYGAVTYANEAKHDMLGVSSATLRKYGAVSGQVAAEMAFGAASMAGADYALAITGIAGPDGGTLEKPVGLVYIALAAGGEVFVKKLKTGGRSREYVRALSVLNALDMLRRQIQGYAIPEAKRFTKGQEANLEREGRPKRKGGAALRMVLATVAVLVVLALALLGSQLSRGAGGGSSGTGSTGENTAGASAPSALGLTYGTAEYTAAAAAYVEAAMAADTQVAGLLAFPGGRAEQLVAKARTEGQAALAASAALGSMTASGSTQTNGMPLMAADATPGRASTNILAIGGDGLDGLLSYQNVAAAAPDTFTYYTPRDAKVYRVLGVFLADAGDMAAAGFSPVAQDLSGYQSYLDFLLGVKARSLYNMPTDTLQTDSFLTVAVAEPDTEGRTLYIVGRLARPGEDYAQAKTGTPAGSPLMPTAWYREQKQTPQDENELAAYWMGWYLSQEVTNSQLQLDAGLAANDASPYVTVTLQARPVAVPVPQSTASSSSEETSSESASSSSGEGDSSSSSDGSSSGSGSDGSSSEAPSSNSESASDEDAAASSGGSSSSSSSGSSSSQSESSSSQPDSSQQVVYQPVTLQVRQKPDPDYLTVTMNGQRTTGPTADILAQICQQEAAGAPTEVVKAVAIAAHSWILNQQGAGIEAPTVTGLPASTEIKATVREVADTIVSGDGTNPAACTWHQLAANGTNTAENLWGTTRGYLTSVSTPYEQGVDDWRQTVTIPVETFAAQAATALGADLTGQQDPSRWFSDILRSEAGYVESLTLGGTAFSGSQFWQLFADENGVRYLASPAFEVEASQNEVTFTTYGKGHGCGLSLYGATVRANDGWDHERILTEFYPGAKLMVWE